MFVFTFGIPVIKCIRMMSFSYHSGTVTMQLSLIFNLLIFAMVTFSTMATNNLTTASAPQRNDNNEDGIDGVHNILLNLIYKVKDDLEDDLDKVEDDIEDDLMEERQTHILDLELEKEMRKQEINDLRQSLQIDRETQDELWRNVEVMTRKLDKLTQDLQTESEARAELTRELDTERTARNELQTKVNQLSSDYTSKCITHIQYQSTLFLNSYISLGASYTD